MRVLHVIPSLGPRRGGPSFALPVMAEAQARLGLDVYVISTDDDGPDRHLDVPLYHPVERNGVTYHYFRRQSSLYTASWPLTRWMWRHVGEFDVVHTHALFTYAAVPAAAFAARAAVPYVVRPLGTLNRWGMEQRRPLLKELSFRLVEKRILAGAAAIHYTSSQEEEQAALLGVPPAGVVIPLGLDLATFSRLPPPSAFDDMFPLAAGKRVILFMSRIDEKKGLNVLLTAFAPLARNDPDVLLVVAGSGDPALIERLKDGARDHGIDGAIAWTGFLDGAAKRAALARADVFVLPSYSENFGVAAVEAMAAGVPTVLSQGVAVARDMSEAEAGLAVPPEPAALGEALARLLGDAALAARCGENAKRLVLQTFSADTSARRLRELYERVSPAARKVRPFEVHA